MGKVGARSLVDEKTLMSELGKLFHVARANVREQRNTSRAQKAKQKTTAARTTADIVDAENATSDTEKKEEKKGQKKGRCGASPKVRRRGSRRGGTVWVLLKGGFARVPTAEKTALIAHNSAFRGRLSERRRVAALEAAEEYVRTAWHQAREAGLLLPDGSAPSGEEGFEYLREQYAVAASMLRREPVGAQLRRTVEQTVPNHLAATPVAATTAASTSTTTMAAAKASSPLFTAEEWAGFIARENVILKRFASSAAAAAQDDGEMIMHEAALVASQYYFTIAEPLAPVDSASADGVADTAGGSGNAHGGEQAKDVLPTKCIVRIRNSNRTKRTTIIASVKAANYFKSNFMQVIRKELATSKLPRGEDHAESKQQHGTNTSADNNTSGPSKKNTRKSHK